jgi:RecJ-like exonuclease
MNKADRQKLRDFLDYYQVNSIKYDEFKKTMDSISGTTGEEDREDYEHLVDILDKLRDLSEELYKRITAMLNK